MTSISIKHLCHEIEVGGFDRCGFRLAQHKRATDFFLLRQAEEGIRFYVDMVDVADRLEVGVVCFEKLSSRYLPGDVLDIPRELVVENLTIERLVLCEEHGDIDSGLVISTPTGGEILIVPGVYPFTIEVKMTPSLYGLERFDPEYSVDLYKRVPVG